MNKQFKPGEAVIVDAGLGITKQGNIQRITETLAYVKHYNGSVVGYRHDHIKSVNMTEQKQAAYGAGLSNEYSMIQQILEKNSSVKVNHFGEMGEVVVEDLEPAQMNHYMSVITKNSTFTPPLSEKKLTPAELKKREEVAKAMERENPGMPMDKKMAIATATAKKVAEEAEQIDEISKKTAMSYLTKAGKELDTGSKTPEKRDKRIDGYFAAGKRLAGEKPTSEEKAHTVPKTAKEKDLAAMAHPKDKITHADVMVGRGVKREGAMDMLKRVGSKVLDTLGHGDDEQMRKDLQKKMGIPQTGKPGMATQKEDVHYCAKHVFSERFGEGMVVEGQHAEPDEQGLIEWYDVDFGGQVRRVMTEKVKVMHAEYHMNHKKMKEEDEIEIKDGDDKKQMKEMSSKEKMKRGLYNKEETEQIDEKITIDDKGNRVDNSVKLQPNAAASKTDASVTAYYAKLKAERDKKKQSEMGEELKGNQHKIDKNKNGKIDAHDFKLLRKESVLDEGRRDAVLKTTATNTDDNDVHVTALRAAGLHASQGAGANNHIIVPPEHEKKARELLSKHLKEELEEATENLPGKATHLTNKDIRHAEHGIIPDSTTLRHLGGNEYEVRAGRAKGKTIQLDKQHVQKLSMEEVEQLEELEEASAGLWANIHAKRERIKRGSNERMRKAGEKGAPEPEALERAQAKSEEVELDEKLTDDAKQKIQTALGPKFPNNTLRKDSGPARAIIGLAKTNPNNIVKKEEVELDEAMISYSDFQDKIKSHQKAGNQIKDDKYDKKKASYTVVDQEGTAKKITHTDSGVSQQHLGSVKRKDDDESSETKPTETRGRGRPAGSKSGARN